MNEYNINEHIVKKLKSPFGGSERKRCVILDDGHMYLLKLPDPTREVHRTLSYINNAISEYIGCKVFESVGLPVQQVFLGEFTDENRYGECKSYIGCACRNIVPAGFFLSDADKASLGSDVDPKAAELPSFATLEMIAKQDDGISREELFQFYCNQFVVDALIGNPDRHNGNWGFLTGAAAPDQIAPVYDCGSSLCPLYTDEELSSAIVNNNTANALSAIRDENGKNIVYKDYLLSGKNEDVNAALLRIVPRINIGEICRIVNETPYISDKRKGFYKEFLTERYTKVLLPALEKVLAPGEMVVDETISDKEVYEFHKWCVKPFGEIGVGHSKEMCVNGEVLFAQRVTNKLVMLVNPKTHEAEAIFSVRSSNRDVRKTMAVLRGIFGEHVDVECDSLDGRICAAKNAAERTGGICVGNLSKDDGPNKD